MKRITLTLLPVILITACGGPSGRNTSTDTGIDSASVTLVKEAYTFGLPLVLMDITRKKFTDGNNPEAAAENTFLHKSYFPDASFRDVVRPNADTYYSTAFLDLKNGPVVLSVPNTHGRYYMMPMLDAWTNVFASPGTRTTGNTAHDFLVSGPGWKGTVPAGMEQITAPTDMVWIIGRTQVNNKEDGAANVIPLQKQYRLTPLSVWGKTYTPPAAAAGRDVPQGGPNEIVRNMPVDEFFSYLNRLMLDNPPAAADQSMVDKFALIGIKAGAVFKMNDFNKATQEAITKIPEETFNTAMNFFQDPGQLEQGWNPLRGKQGTYGTDYATRALIAIGGLGANLREDAMYPSAGKDADGKPLNGAHQYVLHFEKGKTPPAKAFWSITLYGPDGYMVDNPIKRNAIGDRSSLKKNADGSLDIYIQRAHPGKDKESNWLPAAEGDFNVILRVYWPDDNMLKGNWMPPGIRRIS
jgi:DNA sulfur modification protein DndE